MRKFKFLPILMLLCFSAACTQQPAEPVATKTEKASAPGKKAKAKNKAKSKAAARAARQELKSPLPENFALPFKYRRMYDNTAKTKDGRQQRRVMVEFIDQDAAGIQAALTSALKEKSFSSPKIEQRGTLTQLTFERKDGAAVSAKIESSPKRLVAKGARGTLHLTWDMT